MTKDTYTKLTKPFREDEAKAKQISNLNKYLTYLVFFMYPVLLLFLLMNKDQLLFRAIVVPLDGFIVLSVFRYIINRPRPYEFFDMPPIISKDTKGKSFPSRHVYSAFVIAMTFLFTFPWIRVCILLIIASLMLAIIRVLVGVHYISDVIVGALVGVATALIGFL